MDCPICRGGRLPGCKDCVGGKLTLYTCPRKSVPEDVWEAVLPACENAERNILPVLAGSLGQTTAFVDSFETYLATLAALKVPTHGHR